MIDKEMIVKKLADSGNNPNESKELVNKHYDYIMRVYPDETIKQIAEIIKTL